MAVNPTSQLPGVPSYKLNAGLKTEFGTLSPVAGQVVAYLHHSGASASDNPMISKNICTTLNQAAARCTSGRGDTIMVLPGHAENISSADQISSLVAGTKIVGLGRGTSMPTFTWTAATSTFLLDVANVVLKNLRLNMSPDSGTVSVAAPITVSAAGCAIEDCEIRTSVDANSLSTIPITTTAAADDFSFCGNRMLGATAGPCTTGIQLVGADRLRMIGNFISVCTSGVAIGAVRFLTTASLDILMDGNTIQNRLAASTHAITGMVGATGFVDNTLMLVNSGIAGANTVAELHFGYNTFVCDGGGTSAAKFGTTST